MVKMLRIIKILCLMSFILSLVGCGNSQLTVSSIASPPNTTSGTQIIKVPDKMPANQPQNIANNQANLPKEIKKPGNDPANINNSIDKIKNGLQVAANKTMDTVIVGVDNLGRSDPFKPYQEKSLLFNIPDVPQPPQYDPNSPVANLVKIKVNGLLYNPKGSSAIINVNNEDYLVHKGDMIFDYYIKDITYDKIIIRYGNNSYKAGIGEIIDGSVNINPVERVNRKYAVGGKLPKLPEIKISDPTYLP